MKLLLITNTEIFIYLVNVFISRRMIFLFVVYPECYIRESRREELVCALTPRCHYETWEKSVWSGGTTKRRGRFLRADRREIKAAFIATPRRRRGERFAWATAAKLRASTPRGTPESRSVGHYLTTMPIAPVL